MVLSSSKPSLQGLADIWLERKDKESGCLFTAEATSPYSAVYPAMKMQLAPLNC